MGKILIIYDSESDRKFTSTMVPLVKEGIERVDGMEVRIRHVDEADTEDVFWADGIAIGCPTHLGEHGRVRMLSGVDGTSPALRRQHAALSTFSDFPGIRIEAVSHTD